MVAATVKKFDNIRLSRWHTSECRLVRGDKERQRSQSILEFESRYLSERLSKL